MESNDRYNTSSLGLGGLDLSFKPTLGEVTLLPLPTNLPLDCVAGM